MKLNDKKLHLDWASYKAAKYACENWHYSGTIPVGKTVKVGVWEYGEFKGVVIFSRGANKSIGGPYGLEQDRVCELTRVALKEHEHTVTKIISIAFKLLKKKSPDLKLVVSYADLDQEHQGTIYQAGNWIYEGLVNEDTLGAFIVKGRKMHPKSVHSRWGKGSQRLKWLRENVDENAEKFITKGKHKYLYALDEDIKDDILKLHQPYPK